MAVESVARCRVSVSAEKVAQPGELLGYDPEVGPPATLLALQEPSADEHLEVVADGRLAQSERLLEMADARFAIRLGLNQAQQPKPRGVGEDAERARELLGVVRCERLDGERGTARCDGRDRLHGSHIDTDR